MSDGKLKKHAQSPTDIHNFFFRNNVSSDNEYLNKKLFVAVTHIDEAKKDFPDLEAICPKDPPFSSKGAETWEELVQRYISVISQIIEWEKEWFGGSS